MDRSEVVELLARISRCFGRPTADTATVDQWHMALERYSLELGHQGLDRIIDDGRPGPNLVQMLQYIRAVERDDAPRTFIEQEWEGANDRGRQHIASIRSVIARARPTEYVAKLQSGKLKRQDDARDYQR